MSAELWQQCVDLPRDELLPQQFNTWVRPLQVRAEGNESRVYAPNRFALNWVNERYLGRLLGLLGKRGKDQLPTPSLLIGSRRSHTPRAAVIPLQTHMAPPPPVTPPPAPMQPVPAAPMVILHEELPPMMAAPSVSSDPYEPEEPSIDPLAVAMSAGAAPAVHIERDVQVEGALKHTSYLNRTFTSGNSVEGKSNQLARAVAWQAADDLKHGYDPPFLCGSVDLGKTYLMHVVDNHLLKKNPNARVVYLHSERFAADMVKALQLNAINKFKHFYRSVDTLLIDDIRSFARRECSQEKFFHAFDALLEDDQQVILTSNHYPKGIEGLGERLKSRFGWGPAVTVEPSKLETRVAILMEKAEQAKIELPYDAAFFIAQRIRSNVRELKGTLKRVITHSYFMGRPITIELTHESLKDLLALQDKLVSIDDIQRTVAEHYKVKMPDPLSKRRPRSMMHPRQVTMAFSKESTNHSLPEIGAVFGGRDHTIILHTCRKITQLRESDASIREDYKNLLRTLTI